MHAQTKPLIIIVDWSLHFETYESLRLKGPGQWVALPTKHDGRSYRRIMSERDGAAIYGAWITLVQVAKKMPVRGTLADASGPLDAEDLADKTLVPQKTVERMLQFVTGERIGWAKLVTDTAETTAILREVAAACGNPRKNGHNLRDLPQAPADARRNGANLRENRDSPADCGDARSSAGTPADSRTSAEKCGDSRPSRVRAGGQDRTGQDSTGQNKTHTPAAGPASVSESALLETSSFVLSLFRKKRTRLSTAAEHELSRHASDLPLSAAERDLLTWFYSLPHDAENIDLRGRHADADKLACNLFAALDRAEAYRKKIGAPAVPTLAREPAPATAEPAGCWEWYANACPNRERPASWYMLPESVRSAFDLERRKR